MTDFKPGIFQRSYVFFLFVFSLLACNSGADIKADNEIADSLTEEQKRFPENALKGLVPFEGLEVRTMATEPMLKRPGNRHF